MQKGMVDNEDDATLSSVDHTEEGFLAAADVDEETELGKMHHSRNISKNLFLIAAK